MLFRTSMLFALSILSLVVVAQDTLHYDTTQNLIIANPAGFRQPAASATFTSYDVNNNLISSNNKGVSLLNNLYGQVPNLSLGLENTYSEFEGFRHNATPLMVVDGVSMNLWFLPYSGASSFDFQNLQVIPDLNGATMYGAFGSNGVFLAESKSGKNDERGTIELNSFTQEQTSDFASGAIFSDQDFTVQSTALALQRDFGKVDTRVSVNHSGLLDYDIQVPGVDYKTNRLNINANTGYVDDKIEVRAFVRANQSHNTLGAQKQDVNLFHSHVKFNYNSGRNWRISSNAAWQNGTFDLDAPDPFFIFDTEESRFVANAFFQHSIALESGSLSTFAGLQLERYEFQRVDSLETPARSSSLTSAMAGIRYEHQQSLYVNLDLRADDPKDDEAKKVYSAGAGMMLNRLLKMDEAKISIARFRVSYAHSEVVAVTAYPQLFRFLWQYPALGYEKNAFETGFDLAFTNNKWDLTLVYYRDEMRSPGSDNVIVNKGIELTTKIQTAHTASVDLSNSIILGYSNGVDRSYEPLSVGSQKPDFGMALLTELHWSKLYFNAMLDWRSTGEYQDHLYLHGRDKSLRLRFASVGYEFSLPESIFREVSVGVIARNLMLTDEQDPELVTDFSMVTSSIGLNLNFVF